MKAKSIIINAIHTMATIISAMLCAVLFVCANTNSSVMIHQPEAPEELMRFRKVK